jgi:hypothetical protein
VNQNNIAPLISRRALLRRSAVGFGSLALASMLADESSVHAYGDNPLAPQLPLIAARAKRIIFLMISGGHVRSETAADS